MAAIRSKDTKPEMIVRRGLWNAWTSGLGAEKVSDVHLCEWVLLAWTPYQFTI